MAKKRSRKPKEPERPAGVKSISAESGGERCLVVGIGASAGGLEAIEAFFSGVPERCNMAFVVVQHLAPRIKSVMPELLSRWTWMGVEQIVDGMPLEPGHAYVNAPGCDAAVLDGKLFLTRAEDRPGVRLPIDFFFRSLAADQGEHAVGIVLSGTGTDGTLGLGALKGAGGLVMAQDVTQARYSGMPRSAIDAGVVDFVLPVEQMAAELVKYAKHPFLRGGTSEVHGEGQLVRVFQHLRRATGHDFSHYKRNTIRRRIERRMAVHQIETLAQYVSHLREVPAEVEALFRDLLIGVTSFFRDPGVFAALESAALPALLQDREPDTPVRIWVAGCATGEEAYSIAICLLQVMERLHLHFNVQIFATDIDAEAIERARVGIYPESIVADVPQAVLERYFTKDDTATGSRNRSGRWWSSRSRA